MKHKILGSVLTLFMVFCLFSCDKEEAKPQAVHNFTENYLFDNEKHWKECTDEMCVQKTDVAIHQFLNWTTTVQPTCSKPGKEVSKCSVCDYVLERDIPVTDHKVVGDWKTDANSHWHKCENDATEKVDFGNHSFEWIYETAPTCTTSGYGHQECAVCGYKLENQTVPAFGHDWQLDEDNTSFATCTEDGVVVHKCARCGASESKNVAAGHVWGRPVYEWNDDYTEVTATRACSSNSTHIETETVSVDKIHVNPTCQAAGSDTYTTKAFTNPAFEVQSKVINLPKCSNTLVHYCDAEKFTGCTAYDECSICKTRYNEAEIDAPWENIDFETSFPTIQNGKNNSNQETSYDADTNVISLPAFSGNSAKVTFLTENPISPTSEKKYFALTVSLVEKASGGGWWDTYLAVGGNGPETKIRFGQIAADAVAIYDFSKITFITNGQECQWNGVVEVGGELTILFDLEDLGGSVNYLTFNSDGGAKLKIEHMEFRSCKCEHDIHSYVKNSYTSCLGIISTKYDECSLCGYKDFDKTSSLPEGYTSANLSAPIGIRGDNIYYDSNSCIVNRQCIAQCGPKFEIKSSSNTLYLEFTILTLGDTVGTNPLAFCLSTGDVNWSNRYFIFMKPGTFKPDGLVGETAKSSSEYFDLLNESGTVVNTFAANETFILRIDLAGLRDEGFQLGMFLVGTAGGTEIQLKNLVFKNI